MRLQRRAMERIVFVNPPMTLEQRYGRLASAGSVMPPLGLCSLAAVCRQNGFEPALLDSVCHNLTVDETARRIMALSPRYVGITAMTCGINGAAKVAGLVKRTNANIKTLIGGPHVTALPVATLQQYSDFDIGFIGEAEDSLPEFLKAHSAGARREDICGIVFRAGGEVRQSAPRPFIEKLDSLPYPAWELLQGFPHRYAPAAIRCNRLPATHLVTSRGCPMKCTFCDRSVFGNRYRFFGIEYVVGMIKTLHEKFGVNEILFEDDSFTLHKSRVVALCESLLERGIKISWSCLGRVDSIDAELLTIMKRAGCWQIGFGIESGNADILNGVHKRIDLDRIREALSLTKRSGIHTKGFFVLGLPNETLQSIRKTVAFAKAVALDDISVSFCTPFPGTALLEDIGASGSFSADWDKMNLMNPVFVPTGLTKTELEEFHFRFLRGFYFRPRIVLDYLARTIANAGLFFRIAGSAFRLLFR